MAVAAPQLRTEARRPGARMNPVASPLALAAGLTEFWSPIAVLPTEPSWLNFARVRWWHPISGAPWIPVFQSGFSL